MSDKKDDCFKCQMREIKTAHILTMGLCIICAGITPIGLYVAFISGAYKECTIYVVIAAMVSMIGGLIGGLASCRADDAKDTAIAKLIASQSAKKKGNK